MDCKDSRIAALLNGTYDEHRAQNGKGMTAVETVLRRDHAALRSVLESGGDVNEACSKEEGLSGMDLNGKTPFAAACVLLDDESVKIV